ncbi:hypothetical protein ABES25_04715 [Bacillus gobiensis]|uniref:hypothetical protein n=1 Tax=Bacillus gobiensis TaxID=1441095 RepID=UPI003D19F529
MTEFTGAAKLEELKLMSGGNPEKIAKYVAEKHAYDSLVTTYFSDEFPFAERPNEQYVVELGQKAEETGDDDDKIRYAIMKDRYEHNESKRVNGREDNLRSSMLLRQRLSSGATLTNTDLRLSERLTRANPTVENMVIYSTVRQQLNREE